MALRQILGGGPHGWSISTEACAPYTHDHLNDGNYVIYISDDVTRVIGAKVQSRHSSSKQYRCWVEYAQGTILAGLSYNKLMKGKALRKHSLHEKTAASVLLKLFISGNE